jgi:2-C-methyl-D-erythritol 4-phosphate cytidylyltransferase
VALAGRPLLAWCLEAFAAAESVGSVIVAAPADHVGAMVADGVELVEGGESRSESVAAALERADSELVVVHDAARPLVTAQLIDTVVTRLAGEPEAAGVIAATPITDTVKRVEDSAIVATEDRERLWAAQTPQAFRTEALREALAVDAAALANATDDASLVEARGGKMLIEPAPASNLKVTNPADLQLAELLLGRVPPRGE